MINYYIITTIIMLISLAAFVFVFESSKTNYYFMVWVLLMTLACGGYLALAMSSDIDEALLANKICYLGGCFVPPTVLFLICTICNYRVPTWSRGLAYLYSFFVYSMILVSGRNDIYYTDIYLEKKQGISVLRYSYGIGHDFFTVLLWGFEIASVLLLVFCILKKQSISKRTVWTLIVMQVINTTLYIISNHASFYINIMPLAYVIDFGIVFYMYQKGMMYSVEDNILASLDRQNSYGYIMFDNQFRYLGSNNIASQILPAIDKCVVDKGIGDIKELKPVLDWLDKYSISGNEYYSYEYKEKHYECRIERILFRKKLRGYMLELRDDTDKWNYVNLITSDNSRLERFQLELENKVFEQTEELRTSQNRMEKLYTQTITALSDAVDAKDRYTSGHSKRVAEYARMIAAKLGKSKDEQEAIYRAGLLHDVGKIRIPVEIINKPGKLTDDEYSVIKIHPVTGYHILRGISDDNYIAVAAKYHHERYDGKGYPNGISGDNIPEIARILGVADAYDAMASNRSYRDLLPQDQIRKELENGKGTQFDPKIADIMIQMIDNDNNYVMREADFPHKRILTVDDEPINGKIIKHIMSDERIYDVVSVNSGNDALNILEQQPFDLIMLDLMMPGMDGLETLKLIREKYYIPVVLMTSDKRFDVSVEFEKLGCEDYITKPFLPLIIKEIVHNMTERTNINA